MRATRSMHAQKSLTKHVEGRSCRRCWDGGVKALTVHGDEEKHWKRNERRCVWHLSGLKAQQNASGSNDTEVREGVDGETVG